MSKFIRTQTNSDPENTEPKMVYFFRKLFSVRYRPLTMGCPLGLFSLLKISAYWQTKQTKMKKKAILLIVVAALLSNVSKAQTLQSMTAKQITIRENKVEINYFQQGQGDTTLLFLHGWCINATYWKNQSEYFSKSYNVYAIDLPGFGKSKAERTNWTIEEYTNDVTAFIDAMNLKNVVIIGHSMAGEIMLQAALTNNPKILGIVGVDNFKFIDMVFTPDQMKQMTDFFQMLEKDFKNAAPVYADRMLFHPKTPQEVKDRVKTDFANSDSVIGLGTLINQMQCAYNDAQRLEKLNYTLYLINSDSFPTNETGLKNHCKASFQMETINATGHYPMIEKPTEFNLLLQKVLTGMK